VWVVRRRNERNPTTVDVIGHHVKLATMVALFVAVTVSGHGGVFGGSALVYDAATAARSDEEAAPHGVGAEHTGDGDVAG